MKKLAIIGYGSDVRNDDAAGLIISRELNEKYNENSNVDCYEGLTAVDIVNIFPDYENLFLVDAALLEKEPGYIEKQHVDDMMLTEDMSWSHNTNFKQMIPLAKAMDFPIPNVHFFLVQPENIDMGEIISPKVRLGIDKLKEMIEKDIQSLLK
jgi:hydrogenase maturation protease